jgi:hypothetical protein
MLSPLPSGAVANSIDMEAFTGRGCFLQVVKQARVQQKQIHLEMNALREKSRLKGSGLYLEQHKYAAGTWKLRWRLKTGSAFKHVLWVDVASVVAVMPVAYRRHYEILNRRVGELNTLDVVVQHTLKCFLNFLEGQTLVTPQSDSRVVNRVNKRRGEADGD